MDPKSQFGLVLNRCLQTFSSSESPFKYISGCNIQDFKLSDADTNIAEDPMGMIWYMLVGVLHLWMMKKKKSMWKSTLTMKITVCHNVRSFGIEEVTEPRHLELYFHDDDPSLELRYRRCREECLRKEKGSHRLVGCDHTGQPIL